MTVAGRGARFQMHCCLWSFFCIGWVFPWLNACVWNAVPCDTVVFTVLCRETLECILSVVICILEIGQRQELPLFFQVIQWKFCGKTGNYLLLNRQKIITITFSVLNYVAKLRNLTIVCSFLNSVLQALPRCEAFIKSPPHICLCRCCLPKYGYIQQRSGKNLFILFYISY